jgi:hypothetical protein
MILKAIPAVALATDKATLAGQVEGDGDTLVLQIGGWANNPTPEKNELL